MKRRSSSRPPSGNPGPSNARGSSPFTSTMLAIIGGVFVLGIALGVVFSSNATSTPDNVASIQYIDQSAPNPELCQAYGASATVMDSRMFVTFKPFSVFISQPVMQPGCVVRRNNIGILQQRKLISNDKMRKCRQRLNTFGFTGELGKKEAQINCIYQSDRDKNAFLQNGGSTVPEEADNF